MDSIEGKVAVVTGAASGIGAAVASRFAEAGARVVVADVDAEGVELQVSEITKRGHTAIGAPTDVADLASVQALADTAVASFGGVDVVCNNAGVLVMGKVWEADDKAWRRLFDVNFWGVVNGVRTFVPLLLGQGRGGHIVNTASMGGLTVLPTLGPYVTSKHAVVALTETLFLDLQTTDPSIGISVLCPGMVPTRLGMPDRRVPLRPPGPGELSPDSIAEQVLDAVLTNRFYILTHTNSMGRVRERFAGIEAGGPPAGVVIPGL